MGVGFNWFQTVGTLCGFLLGEFLPDADDTEGLRKTNNWRISYVYFPVAVNLLVILGMLFVMKHDSIKFLINNNNIKEARLAVKQMYADA